MILNEILNKIEDDIDYLVIESNDYSLFNGKSGVILYYYLMYKDTHDDRYLLKIQKMLDIIINDINESEVISLTFCNGLSGVGYILNILLDESIIEDNKLLLEIDSFIIEGINKFKKNNNYDFLHGYLGLLFYLKKRNESTHLYKNLYKDLLFDYINYVEKIIKNNNKNAWNNDGKNNAFYNLGMAHGLISSICFLSTESFLYQEKIKELLHEIVNLILSFKDDKSLIMFPAIIDENMHSNNNDTPLGWCYGDNIIAWGLLKAGKKLSDNKIIKKAIDIGIKTINRENEINLVEDSIICHGLGGVAYVYKRLFEETDNVLFIKTGNKWKNKIYTKMNNIDTLAGLKTFISPGNYSYKYGFLNGALGTLIVLKSFINEDSENFWNEILLLN